ncbi:MAG: type II/IV secretion system protein [Verrucomicrobia bacterium]|nr:type II/IV secretion system protein [Verrucomicrobiota bacterium]MBV9298595.1 type II/IV secretion system protein [Verrucomicrobiota bacterium]MBV9645750.1 type II/IV secretion system protein [Verrucomicrobiota bacterium]
MALVEPLIEIAKANGCADLEACRKIVRAAVEEQRSVIQSILESRLVDETGFLNGISRWLEIPWWNEPITGVPAPLREKVPARTALRYRVIPLREDEHEIWIAFYDPFDLLARQTLASSLDQRIMYAMATRSQIVQALRQGYGVGAETFEAILEGRSEDELGLDVRQETNVLDLDDSEASVVKFVNQILREALEQRATDIHVEPLQDDLQIRYRIDGVLHEVPVPPNIKVLQASVISRLKIMAHLDIAERRLPQDGRINLELDAQPIDVRVATIPSVAGESISLRLLGRERFTFDRLGLEKAAQSHVRQLLAMPNGIVLLTGPTGCGKSTTLYTFLASLNTKERRIVTVEDPVEYKLPGVIQIAVKPEIDLTFANGLRSILRGDPNVIMVGEMRDRETAEIAIRGALTGHLVFSTLHTNDAIGGITRLVDMGIEPFLVANAVRVFIAQRLVRVLCARCKRSVEHAETYLNQIGFPLEQASKTMAAVGCDYCRHTGYEGRAAIFEFCAVSQRLQDLITQGRPESVIRAAALEEGMIPLRMYGWTKVISGLTTVEEVVRVTASDLEMSDE